MIGMISCKEATYLISKKEEGKLTLAERLKLSVHLAICGICRAFEKQSEFIAHHATHVEDTLNPDIQLSDVEKTALKTRLKD